MTEGDRRDGMQRARVGLTGLAVVLVLLALATALYRAVDPTMPANNAQIAANQADNEPLADMGMAPSEPNSSAPAQSKTK